MCCGTKRLAEIRCPSDCTYLVSAREHPAAVVRRQQETGVDVVNDGEYTKRSWQTYARGRLSGLEYRVPKAGEVFRGSITGREETVFPEYFNSIRPAGQQPQEAVYCTGPLKYIGHDLIKMDIEGAEREALRGAAGTLRRFKPRLMLDSYHRPDDSTVLPQVIGALRSDYRMLCGPCELGDRIAPHVTFYY